MGADRWIVSEFHSFHLNDVWNRLLHFVIEGSKNFLGLGVMSKLQTFNSPKL